ncbi:MAG TPA: SufE family protein [Anaerolineales bacterium]|nr:SufE family protein [Anaerolineales bacterium]
MANPIEFTPPKLQQIIEDFQWSDGREKAQMLVEYSENLPPLPQWVSADHDAMEQVHECMTPVFVQSEIKDGKIYFYFDVPKSSPTVRGFAALMQEGISGSTVEDVIQIPGNFFQPMELEKVLSAQRLHGISAILGHMKRIATNSLI